VKTYLYEVMDEKYWNYPNSSFSMLKHGLTYTFEENCCFVAFLSFSLSQKMSKICKFVEIKEEKIQVKMYDILYLHSCS
jgi:hypothetical protein